MKAIPFVVSLFFLCPVFGQEQIIYSSDSTTYAKGSVVDGHKEGKWELFNKSGRRIEAGEYHLDYKDGVWRSYYEDGKLKAVFTYDHGLLEGDYKEYYEGGFEKTIVSKVLKMLKTANQHMLKF